MSPASDKQSIQMAWPDALDLMLICVELGMSIEAAFKKVSEEIGVQSAELAEELVLTNAELSFLPERRQAYDNLAIRTGLETVNPWYRRWSNPSAMVRPSAPPCVFSPMRVVKCGLMAAEKEAAALPPKLTSADDPFSASRVVLRHSRAGRHPDISAGRHIRTFNATIIRHSQTKKPLKTSGFFVS